MASNSLRWLTPSLAVLGLAASLGAAAAQDSTVIIAPSAPPAPRVETVPPPPATSTQALTWQAGHWVWDGTAWSWKEGRYVQSPQPAAVWEPGHWQPQSKGGYIWIDGHWRD
jgi:hypothetical protein